MPLVEFVAQSEYTPTFRAAKVAGQFDIDVTDKLTRRWSVNLDIEGVDWNVGLIVGPSGSGKTRLAKAAFPDSKAWEPMNWAGSCVLDDFAKGLPAADIIGELSRVGFSSPPNWLLPYGALSNGQQFRAQVARALLEQADPIVIDEFTSVVDRQVAKICSAAVSRSVRKRKRKLVAVSCHYDIVEWLEPDWVVDMSDGSFSRGSVRRPPIEIEIRKCGREVWPLFAPHHYLSGELATAARCAIALVDGEPAAFVSCMHFPHPTVKNIKKEHRLVCLPDYQGVGIGMRVSDAFASLWRSRGFRYYSTSSHPAVIHYRAHNRDWRMVRKPGRMKKFGKGTTLPKFSKSSSRSRLTAAFEYVGR